MAASFTQGYTFGATEEVTAAKLHSLVTGIVVSGITGSEIAASTVTDSNIYSVSGAKLTSLGSTPAGAGDLPEANIGPFSNIDINGGSIDGATLGANSAVTVTNADVNGGTIDDVNIGTETETGMLLVNNASDKADGLGSQGTSGQVLTSQGSGSLPTWSSLKNSAVACDAVSMQTSSETHNNTWFDVPNMSATITTTETSTFFAVAHANITLGGDVGVMAMRVVRDSTAIATSDSYDGTTSYNFSVGGSSASVPAGTYTIKLQLYWSSNSTTNVTISGFFQVTALSE